MHILPISNINISKNNTLKITKPAFTAHPDFYKYNSTASCFFRRGSVLLSCAKGYENIEKIFCNIFKSDKNNPKKMLIIGIGESQEPLSYLASIKGIVENKPLKNILDLYTVDLQSNPSHINLKKCAFCDLFDYQSFPKYAEKSFVKDSTKNWLEIKQQEEILNPIDYIYCELKNNTDMLKIISQKNSLSEIVEHIKTSETESLHWRVNNEIFDFLEKTYNNPLKSKWDSRIQDVIQDYADNKFDIISANNVIPYIISDTEALLTVSHIERVLKPGGYFITDPYNNLSYLKNIYYSDTMRMIDSGIYQKG